MQLDERKKVLANVLDSPWSDFYRRLYAAMGDRLRENLTEEIWSAIPLLTREHLQSTPYAMRLYVSPTDVHAIRSTGGTTGSGILLIPRTGSPALTDHLMGHPVRPTGFLTFMNPHYISEETVENGGLHIPVVAGEMTDLNSSIQMTSAIPTINAIRLMTHPPEQVWPAFKQTELSARIILLEILGPYWNAWMVRKLQPVFPNATIAITYGMVEIQGTIGAFVVEPREEVDEVLYSTIPGHYLEIRKDDGEILLAQPGLEGELIITTLSTVSTKGLPLIRYRSGDRVRIKEMRTPQDFSFYVLGRNDHDRIKLAFGILWSEELERALAALFGRDFTGEYEFEVESESSQNPRERGILRISVQTLSMHDMDAASRQLEGLLHIAPERTYGDAVALGLLDHIRIEPLPALKGSDITKKRRRMYRSDATIRRE